MDVVSRTKRSEMMAGIKCKNTQPEIAIRKGLYARGIRYRIHVKTIPGHPDIVLSKRFAVIFVHGCFWHMHACSLFRWPKSRQAFWRTKIEGNNKRDKENESKLIETGWRVCTIWECALKGKYRQKEEDVILQIEQWISSNEQRLIVTELAHV